MNEFILVGAWRRREERGAKTRGLEWMFRKENGKGVDKLTVDGRVAEIKRLGV